MAPKIKIGIIGGSGLDDPQILENKSERQITTPYGDPSDVVIEGTIKGVPCALLARHGRKHSVQPHSVNYRANIWALREVGCTHVVATTATGSLREDIKPGTFVVFDNFIDRTHGRQQTFYDGSSSSPRGVCHLPMEPAVCPRTRRALLKACSALGFQARDGGTVVTIQGPRFSSKAESKMFQLWGGDLINMSSCPEVVLAKEAGLCYAAIALATDYDCWREEGPKVSVPEVLSMFFRNVEKLKAVLIDTVAIIAGEDWKETIEELQETVKNSVMYKD